MNSAPATNSDLKQMANAIRVLSMDAVEAANSGHPGMPMGMADAATVLFANHLKFDPTEPHWPDRDRFILSAGHGSMLIYALLHLTGYADMTIDELKNFRQMGAKTAGHPEFGHATGIETTTGPLGQGISNAVGFAMAERHLNALYGDDLVDHHTYVIAGDGCLMEGISHEAASLAGHWKLDRMIVLFDDNGISIDGPTDIAVSDDITKRFEAYGWQVLSCDGHDMDAVDAAIHAAKADTNRPSLIRCKTEIGKGSPNRAGTAKAHGAPLGADEIQLVRDGLGWDAAPFEIPQDIMEGWRAAGARGKAAFNDWQARLDTSASKASFKARMSGDVSADADKAIQAFKKALAEEPQKVATRVASQKSIEALITEIPSLFGGSADLTGSNNTKVGAHEIFSAENYAGSYIHYGVREHGMAAAMNGAALHGGVIPFGGTFLVFTDYCRPSIRLSALMEQRVIYVMTHDSIGLGEDGPTHQPVEHVASLRAIPNLLVFRPADIVETAECWQLAVENQNRPSVLALSRQGLAQLRTAYDSENRAAKGGYILQDCAGTPDITLMATGSEVSIAADAKAQLESAGHKVRLVSVPSLELLKEQGADYLDNLRGGANAVIAVEAGLEMGWSGILRTGDGFIGMNSFGASAPAGELYAHFGITAEAISAKATKLLAG
ncbi:MAG: transketolase [Candidatus Puniceispirillaceae bacterium]